MKRCFIVLGMHRSATSLISKGLNENKVNMGDNLLGSSRSNESGHFEDLDFLEINKQILSDAKGDWDNPPSESDILNSGDKYKEKIKDLLKKKMINDSFGWKDPRNILTIKVYIPILKELGIEPFFICCFRDSLKVAESLYKRNGMEISKGLELADEYNRRLLNFLEEYNEN